MRIGIVSDTHGWVHPELATVFRDVDLILHAGDVGPPHVLEALEQVAPVRAVYGNIDGPPVRKGLAPEALELDLEGVRFWMTHIGGRPGRWARGIRAELQARRPDVFVCGHSHILRVERVPELGGLLYVNPGAAGRQGFHQVKTCLRMTVEAGALKQAEVVELDG